MKTLTFISLLALTFASACTSQSKSSSNPLLADWTTPYGVPPFEQIKPEHYMPAFEEAIIEHNKEIEQIVQNTEAPSFDNTILALENAGAKLNRVSMVFFNFISHDRSNALSSIEEQIIPILSKHGDEISMNETLFTRIKTVYDQKDMLKLQGEDLQLLNDTYRSFERNGANLSAEDKTKLKAINEELSVLASKYTNNILKDNNAFRLSITNQADLAGLPESSIAAAAELAKTEGQEGQWMFTLDKPSLIPFLTYSQNRELREKMFKGYANRGNNNDVNDNKKFASRIAVLSLQKAKLLGFHTAAEYIIDDRMAKTPQAVLELLDNIWKPTQVMVEKERKALQAIIDKEKGGFKLQAWDWWYYAEKVKQEVYQFDEAKLSEYLQLENVVKGCFDVSTKLYGITFEELNDMPKFNSEAKAYLVKDADGSDLAIFYADYHPRASKSGGAWMTLYRSQKGYPDANVIPVVINICNFTRATADKPALLSLDEVETLFHEFGHALHGMLSKCKYESLASPNVKGDFVELPSQIMEHWATEPQVMKAYAKHYKTGETVPDELIESMQKASKFNQGFATTEFIAAAYLDMAWYSITSEEEPNVEQFEKAAMDKIGLISEIIPRYRSTYFSHIFGGGYSAGYYNYIWAEVLDCDAFAAFKETGDIFNSEVARKFRTHILEKGGSQDPMELYLQFRGRKPTVEPLMEKRGLK